MEHSILLVEDDQLLAENIQTYLERKNFEVTICHSAEDALQKLTTFTPDVVLTDNSLPGMSGHDLIQKLRDSAPDLKVIMMTGYGNVEDAVIAMKEGAFHYVTKPVALAELKLLLDKAMATDRMERTLSFYQEREAQKSGVQALIGDSAPMQYLKGTIAQLLDAERRMANTDLPPVLVEGETGTGKELVARALHFDGPRSKGPFIEFNCASIPSNLVESELFGHEKGAFTDAKDRRVGLVEAADGGTLFLDEVGEMDLLLQAKLLKLLEDRTIRRVGSVKERKVDLRVISATNCNLEQMVQQGKFRRDLFFRLRIISIKVPRLLCPSLAFFMFDGIRRLESGFEFVDASCVTNPCRYHKSPAELALMQRAKDMTLEVQKAAASILRAGISTTEVAEFIREAHRKVGAPGSTFCIVLFGEASAFPHGVKHAQVLKDGDMVLIDTGCLLHGYQSDITRSYVFGTPNDRQRAIWNLEKTAQQAAFDAARLGEPCQAVDAAARLSLEAAGLGPDYQLPGLPHRTGHGIGLDIHEGPYLVRGDQTPLAEGMCFSNEPMICVPGEFGIRLEDHFYMTATGPRWFTQPSHCVDDPFGLEA